MGTLLSLPTWLIYVLVVVGGARALSSATASSAR
jgi:hypothetical protein